MNFGDRVTDKAPRKNYRKGDKSRSNLNPTFPKAETVGTKQLMTQAEWEAFCAKRRKLNL